MDTTTSAQALCERLFVPLERPLDSALEKLVAEHGPAFELGHLTLEYSAWMRIHRELLWSLLDLHQCGVHGHLPDVDHFRNQRAVINPIGRIVHGARRSRFTFVPSLNTPPLWLVTGSDFTTRALLEAM